MQQLTFIKTKKLEWREVPPPSIEEPEDVLVRPFAAARCDLDYALLTRPFARNFKLGRILNLTDDWVLHSLGPNPYKGPFAFGHECVAEVVEVGERIKNFKKGDKVIVPFNVSCGTCLSCRTNLTANCNSVEPFAMFGGIGGKGNRGGALSDLLKVPFGDHMLVSIPEEVDPIAIASLSDNIPDGWRAVGPALKEKPGADVLIVSGLAKSVGLYAAGLAVALGASKVDYLDRNRNRLEIAKSLGANPIEDDHNTFTGKYSITVDAASSIAGLHCAIRNTAPGGICTSVGIYPKKHTSVPMFKMYSNNITLKTGITNARVIIPEALSIITRGLFKPDKVTTLLADWQEAPRAFLENTVKVVVKRPLLYN